MDATSGKSMDAFEMWCWRAPYIAHPWTARRTNASVVEVRLAGDYRMKCTQKFWDFLVTLVETKWKD